MLGYLGRGDPSFRASDLIPSTSSVAESRAVLDPLRCHCWETMLSALHCPRDCTMPIDLYQVQFLSQFRVSHLYTLQRPLSKLQRCHSVAAVFYEYGLTSAREVRQYWGRPLNVPSALFFANRYMCLISRIVLLSAMFAEPSEAVSV